MPNAEKQEAPFIVYQMGKVASSSVLRMFEDAGYNRERLLHVHTLNPQAMMMKIINNEDWQKIRHVNDQIEAFRAIRKLYGVGGERLFDGRVKIISLVRDPLARAMSAFFFRHADFFPGMIERYEAGYLTVEEIAEVFYKRHQRKKALVWFDNEFKPSIGIDVFEFPFQKEKGYIHIKTSKFDLTLLQSEILWKADTALLEKIFEIPGLEMPTINTSSTKPYEKIYKEFKRKIAIKEEILDLHYNQKFTRHFYSDEQIEEFKRKARKVEE